MFQKNEPDIAHVNQKMELLVSEMKDRLYTNSGREKDVAEVKLGSNTSIFLQKMDPTVSKEIREVCCRFLRRAYKETLDRVSINMKLMARMAKLTPALVLDKDKEINAHALPFLQFIAEDDIDKVDSQLNKIKHFPTEELFDGTIPSNPAEFWCTVNKFRDSEGVQTFKELSDFFLTTLTLPMSTCYVERIFSIVTYIKDKGGCQ